MSVLNISPNLTNYTNIIKRHTDEEGNAIVQQIYKEKKQIVKGHILLEQVPHPHMGIVVTCFFSGETSARLDEIDINSSVKKDTEYKIDYNEGKIWFHKNLEGKEVEVDYWGIGYELIHTSRVYTNATDDGSFVETLDTLIDKGYEALTFLADYPGALQEGRDIVTKIEEGKIVLEDIQTTLPDARETLDGLNQAIVIGDILIGSLAEAKTVNNNLVRNTTDGHNTNGQLEVSIDRANALLGETNDANITLTYLNEANETGKELVGALDKFDNAKFNILASEWTGSSPKKYRLVHNLKSINLLVACYDSSDYNVAIKYRILDVNTIEFEHSTEINMTAIINIAYRGKNGNTDGEGGLTNTQINDVNDIPNIRKKSDNNSLEISNLQNATTPSALISSIKGVDGSGSGLDADLLDGRHANEFSLSGHTHAVVTTFMDSELRISTNGSFNDPWTGTKCAIKANGHIATRGDISADGLLWTQGKRIFVQGSMPSGSKGDIWFKNA